MTRRLTHRGPDDAATLTEEGVALGHRRLSIVDLSAAGHQPMVSSDRRWVVSYNGEIYNQAALRETLRHEGIVFRGHSDTEVLVESLARWGEGALARLDGMFAFAAWDRHERLLLLARDRFGIKPLYWSNVGGALAFASEIKALAEGGFTTREMNPAALGEFMWFGNALGDRTLYDGVRRLRPGHRLRLSGGEIDVSPWWTLEALPQREDGPEVAVKEVRRRLEAAVGSHLMGDVPVGVFLSGGLDSSAITAFAARATEGALSTYSVAFDFDLDRGHPSELPKARLVAERVGADHHELHVSAGGVVELVERLVDVHDEPFSDAANIPLYLLCEALGGDPKVVLQGDGGDEIFAGYRRYRTLARPVLRWLARLAAAPATALAGGEVVRRATRYASALGQRDPALRMALLLTVETLREPPTEILAPSLRAMMESHDPFAEYRRAQRRFGHLDAVQRMLYTDTSILLPDTFLEKVDKPTMAWGIEARVPFLAQDLAEYVMGLPSDLKLRDGVGKWLLREAVRGLLPDSILDAPKQGFGVPYGRWLREDLRGILEDVVLDPALMGPLFDPSSLRRCMDEHLQGRRDHSFLLWKCLNLGLWYRARIA